MSFWKLFWDSYIYRYKSALRRDFGVPGWDWAGVRLKIRAESGAG